MSTPSPSNPSKSLPLPSVITPELLNSYDFRRGAAQSFLGFCLIYLPHYFTLKSPNFHIDLASHLENHDERFLEIIGFRGGAKSTLASTALILWAALEHPTLYPFIIPIADTSTQAKLNISSIKFELDHNHAIRQDYGEPHYKAGTKAAVPDITLESEEEWQAQNMLLANGVRILARSRGQKLRGMKHKQHRPKLVIIDDPEDLKWVKTKENRNTTERWLRGEVLPGIDETNGRVILIGNWLNEDALMARMEKTGIFTVLRYPLIKPGDGPYYQRCAWPAKYPTKKALDDQRAIAGEVAWQREYLLKAVPEEGQPIKRDDLHFYAFDKMQRTKSGRKGHGVDLAISTKDTADYTACVDGYVYYDDDGTMRIYIQPNPLNARLDFRGMLQALDVRWGDGGAHIFFVEDVAYQRAAIEELERQLVPVEAVHPTTDKLSRLQVAALYIKNGVVLFPEKGAEDLIDQLLGFGVEAHDDLVDALVYLILGLVGKGLALPRAVHI